MSRRERLDSALGESIAALGARVEDVTEQLAQLQLDGTADGPELDATARTLEAAVAELSTAHAEFAHEMEALRELLHLEHVRYRDLFESHPEAYIVTTADGQILAANRAAAELVRLHPTVLEDGSIMRLVPVPERKVLRAMLNRIPMLEVVADWELNLIRRGGPVFPAAVTVAWSRDRADHGGTLRWLVRDITEQKVAEARMVSANIELERRVRERTADVEAAGREKDEAFARLEAVLDQIPAGIVIADAASGKVIAANEHAARLVQEVAGDANALDTWLNIGFHPGGRPFDATERPLLRALASGEAVQGCDIEFERLDGSRALYETSAAPIRNPAGEVVGAVAVYWDLTERLRQARFEREFVTNAAHELRTPLAALSSAVEVLQSGAKEEPRQRERFLAHIEQQVLRLQRLVQSLLLLARVQTLQEKPAREPIEIRSLLEDVAGLDPKGRIRVDAGAADARVHTNRDLAEEALLNLVANAEKYASEGDIVLGGWSDNGVVVLEVADSGPGMTTEQQERATERFYRGRDDADGFGLGLSIAQQAAEALDGRLEFESDGVTGTRARIYLPSADADA